MEKGKKEFIIMALVIALMGASLFCGGTKSALAKSGKIPDEIRKSGDALS
jgi:hypothetical protein